LTFIKTNDATQMHKKNQNPRDNQRISSLERTSQKNPTRVRDEKDEMKHDQRQIRRSQICPP